MTGRMTTHVLDLVRGCGAAGLRVKVSRLSPRPRAFADVDLDAGGRAVLVGPESFEPGVYELIFQVGAYRRLDAAAGDEQPFLDEVPVRFGVADCSDHCHVPLLISHYGYSTYRGG